jgi:hypothetical protein
MEIGPVFSKQNMSTWYVEENLWEVVQKEEHKHNTVLLLTFPVNGIINGFVQKMPRRNNSAEYVLAANKNSISSSGGDHKSKNQQYISSLWNLQYLHT